MPIGSGISSQIGIAVETTPGTPVAPTRYHRFASETLSAKKKIVQVSTLAAGQRFDRSAARFTTQRSAGGDIKLPVPTIGFGLLLQQMLGSFSATAVQQASSAAYLQTHVPGVFTGHTFSAQKGVPRTDGTVEPYTYTGCKVTGWELDMAQSDVLQASLTIDAFDELTAATSPSAGSLGTASYPAAESNFSFVSGSILSGGTVATTSGVTTVTGGTAVAAIRSANIKGSNASDMERYFLGGGTTKAEQIQNAVSSISGQLVAEFASRALYDQYRSDGNTAIQLNFGGGVIASSYHFSLNITLPNVFLEDGASPQVQGPGIITQTIPMTALSNDVDPIIQIQYQSTDTSI